jgi:hypothetical protein
MVIRRELIEKFDLFLLRSNKDNFPDEFVMLRLPKYFHLSVCFFSRFFFFFFLFYSKIITLHRKDRPSDADVFENGDLKHGKVFFKTQFS